MTVNTPRKWKQWLSMTWLTLKQSTLFLYKPLSWHASHLLVNIRQSVDIKPVCLHSEVNYPIYFNESVCSLCNVIMRVNGICEIDSSQPWIIYASIPCLDSPCGVRHWIQNRNSSCESISSSSPADSIHWCQWIESVHQMQWLYIRIEMLIKFVPNIYNALLISHGTTLR